MFILNSWLKLEILLWNSTEYGLLVHYKTLSCKPSFMFNLFILNAICLTFQAYSFNFNLSDDSVEYLYFGATPSIQPYSS